MQEWRATLFRIDIALTLAVVALVFYGLGRLTRSRPRGSGKGIVFADGANPAATRVDWHQIDAELAGGRVISAIKLHRGQTGAGLKESKETVEARRDQLGIPPGGLGV